MENVTFYMEEFRISKGHRVPVTSNTESMVIASEQFYSTISELPEPQQTFVAQRSVDDTSSCSDDDEEVDTSKVYRTNELQIARFHGVMDLRITMKVSNHMIYVRSIVFALIKIHFNFPIQQTTTVQGPKVQLELQLGAINIFLTPRQLHALIYLSNIFLEDNTTQTQEHRHDDTDEDLEHGSQYKQFNAMSGNLGLNQGWSSDPMCMKIVFCSQKFRFFLYSFTFADDQPSQASVKTLEVDTMRESNSMTNSMTSFGSGYTQTTIRNRRRGIIEFDPNADILRLNIRVACCAIILLQEVCTIVFKH